MEPESDAPIIPESDERTRTEVGAPENTGDAAEGESETFDREYVTKLRKENAGYRDRSKAAETRVSELEKRLHAALVAQTGKLADPSDLAYQAEHLDDPEALSAAIDSLLESKPHLRARKISGDIGQGSRGNSPEPVNLLGLLKGLV